MIHYNRIRVSLFIFLFVMNVLIVTSYVCADSGLDKQTENHFRKFLNERNRFDGIEHLGGPFLREYYTKSKNGNITTYAYSRPLGLLGDPNQLDIKSYRLNPPVEIKAFDIASLQKYDVNSVFFEGDQDTKTALENIFEIIHHEFSQQWYQNEVVFVSDDTNERSIRTGLEKEPYFCGIELLEDDTWQLYFRRGHRLSGLIGTGLIGTVTY